MHRERGQALVETAIFLPVALMVMFAMVYFARFGVLEERAQSAVRYGATVSYEGANQAGAAQIYAALSANASPFGGCPAAVATDTVNTLNGVRGGAQAHGFWKPDSAAAATCTVSKTGFTAATTEAYRYLTVTTHSVSGTIDVPSYVSGSIGTTGNVSASLGYVHTASPSVIMYCSAHVGASVSAALNAAYTATGSC